MHAAVESFQCTLFLLWSKIGLFGEQNQAYELFEITLTNCSNSSVMLMSDWLQNWTNVRAIRVRTVERVLTSSTTTTAHVLQATPGATVKLVSTVVSDWYVLYY